MVQTIKKSDLKAYKYLQGNKIFPIKKTDKYLLFAVEADTGVWQVRYDILKDYWDCTCKNVRLTQCSHIKSAILYNDGLEDDKKVQGVLP